MIRICELYIFKNKKIKDTNIESERRYEVGILDCEKKVDIFSKNELNPIADIIESLNLNLNIDEYEKLGEIHMQNDTAHIVLNKSLIPLFAIERITKHLDFKCSVKRVLENGFKIKIDKFNICSLNLNEMYTLFKINIAKNGLDLILNNEILNNETKAILSDYINTNNVILMNIIKYLKEEVEEEVSLIFSIAILKNKLIAYISIKDFSDNLIETNIDNILLKTFCDEISSVETLVKSLESYINSDIKGRIKEMKG